MNVLPRRLLFLPLLPLLLPALAGSAPSLPPPRCERWHCPCTSPLPRPRRAGQPPAPPAAVSKRFDALQHKAAFVRDRTADVINRMREERFRNNQVHISSLEQCARTRNQSCEEAHLTALCRLDNLPTLEHVHSIGQTASFLNDIQSLLRALAVYVEQARREEEATDDPERSLAHDIWQIQESGIYHILCAIEADLSHQPTWSQPTSNTAASNHIQHGCKILTDRAPIDNRNYLVFVTLEQLLHNISHQFHLLRKRVIDKRRKNWRRKLLRKFRKINNVKASRLRALQKARDRANKGKNRNKDRGGTRNGRKGGKKGRKKMRRPSKTSSNSRFLSGKGAIINDPFSSTATKSLALNSKMKSFNKARQNEYKYIDPVKQLTERELEELVNTADAYSSLDYADDGFDEELENVFRQQMRMGGSTGARDINQAGDVRSNEIDAMDEQYLKNDLVSLIGSNRDMNVVGGDDSKDDSKNDNQKDVIDDILDVLSTDINKRTTYTAPHEKSIVAPYDNYKYRAEVEKSHNDARKLDKDNSINFMNQNGNGLWNNLDMNERDLESLPELSMDAETINNNLWQKDKGFLKTYKPSNDMPDTLSYTDPLGVYHMIDEDSNLLLSNNLPTVLVKRNNLRSTPPGFFDFRNMELSLLEKAEDDEFDNKEAVKPSIGISDSTANWADTEGSDQLKRINLQESAHSEQTDKIHRRDDIRLRVQQVYDKWKRYFEKWKHYNYGGDVAQGPDIDKSQIIKNDDHDDGTADVTPVNGDRLVRLLAIFLQHKT